MQTVLFLVVTVIVLLGAGGWFFHRAVTTPYKGYEGTTIQTEIPRGWNSDRILDRLREIGVLRDEFVPVIYLKIFRRGDSLKAGTYEFSGELSAIEVVDKLIAGEILLESVTVREGLDRFQVARHMSSQGYGTEDEWRALTGSPELILDLAPTADSLEGYLFPDTYRIAPGTSAKEMVSLMVGAFRRNFGDELAFIANGLDIHETVTLASIVESEAQLDQERPVIAGVYMNRIRKGMLLQADPTVIYAMKLAGTWNGNIRKSDLRIESPYNTYENTGLPPGPISSPGLASLMAAAAPAETEAFYFVSRNDGSHVFSRTHSEHVRNVNEYQREYWRRKRAEERAAATAGTSDDGGQ